MRPEQAPYPVSSMVGVALVLAGLVACGSLDSPDKVHDLRMLALRAEPPEQVFDVPPQLLASLLDGGLGLGSGGTSGFPLPTIEPVKVTGLIADPKGEGRAVHYQFATCARVSDDQERCTSADESFKVLSEGDVTPQQKSAEVSTTLTADFGLLIEAVQRDPYHGFGFLPVPVQLTITAGNEEVIGFKRVLYTGSLDPAHPAVPNRNPIIPSIAIEGHLWAESEVVELNQRADYKILPDLPLALEEDYDKPTFDGSSLHFHESWRYNFFATAGSFSDDLTGGTNIITGDKANIASTWTPRDTDQAQVVTFWVVVRDGRGGENWTLRQGHFNPQ